MRRRDSQGREERLTFAEHLGSHVPELTSAGCRAARFNWAGLPFKNWPVLLPTCLIINPANTLAPSLPSRRLSSVLPPHLKPVCCCVMVPSDLQSVHRFPPLAHFSLQLPLLVFFFKSFYFAVDALLFWLKMFRFPTANPSCFSP